MNLYAYVQGDPVNLVDPFGFVASRKEPGTGGGGEIHAVIGVGGGSYECCDGDDLVRIGWGKVCYGVSVGVSITAGPVTKRCDGIKKGDVSIGPEFGAGISLFGVEGGVSFNNKGASGYNAFGFAKGTVKVTVCVYKVTEKEVIDPNNPYCACKE
jgi:hypothetical protein